MLLAIDAGNTNTVFAVYDGADCRAVWRCRTEADRSADEYAALLSVWLDRAGLDSAGIGDILICSVVPDANFSLAVFCKSFFSRDAVFVGREHFDAPVRLDRPEEIGADRLVNAVSVRAFHTLPAIVVDFGTATTFDVIAADGGYEGGVIAPGIHLSLDALTRAAAKLPRVEISKPPAATGKTTRHAMQSGLYWGYLGLIDGVIGQLIEEMPQPPSVIIATGGLAGLFAPQSRHIGVVEDALTIKGLCKLNEIIKAKRTSS